MSRPRVKAATQTRSLREGAAPAHGCSVCRPPSCWPWGSPGTPAPHLRFALCEKGYPRAWASTAASCPLAVGCWIVGNPGPLLGRQAGQFQECPPGGGIAPLRVPGSDSGGIACEPGTGSKGTKQASLSLSPCSKANFLGSWGGFSGLGQAAYLPNGTGAQASAEVGCYCPSF